MLIGMSDPVLLLSELPSEITDGPVMIPAVGDDLIHPYEPDTGKWMAHCHNGGCGEYIDDWEDVPPADLLCDRCEQAGAGEE